MLSEQLKFESGLTLKRLLEAGVFVGVGDDSDAMMFSKRGGPVSTSTSAGCLAAAVLPIPLRAEQWGLDCK